MTKKAQQLNILLIMQQDLKFMKATTSKKVKKSQKVMHHLKKLWKFLA